MYHIMICDDDKVFIEFIEEIIIQSGIERKEIIFHEYTSGKAFKEQIKEQVECDLLILDRMLGDMDGHEVAVHFRKMFPDATLVLCSGECQPTDESFKVTPFRYLLKAYTEERMQMEMQVIIEQMKSKKEEPFIVGKYYYSLVRLKPSDILYIENNKHGSIIHVLENKMEYPFEKSWTINKKLKDLYELLKNYGFEYAHNSYLVNLKYVVRMMATGELKLVDETLLTVSRSKLKQFRKALAEELASKYMN